MLALIYFGLAICLGDFLCRRFYQFASVAHRCAAAILSGLLISSWFTYLAGLLSTRARQPLLWGNLLFGIAAIAVLSWNRWKHKVIKRAQDDSPNTFVPGRYLPRPTGSSVADWLLIAGYVVLVSWMMFASFNSSDGILRIANQEYSDFGPNTAIMQSFPWGITSPRSIRTSQETASVTTSFSTFRRAILSFSGSVRCGVLTCSAWSL